MPTLIVWGDNDPIIPMSHGIEAHEVMPGSRLEIFEGAAHFLPEFDEKVAEFISIPLVVLAVWFTAQHIKKKVHRAAKDGHEL